MKHNTSTVAIGALLLFMAAPCYGQDLTARPIEIVVPYAAGGNIDITARIIAEPLSTRLDRKIVILNKSGAAGTIGGEYVAKAAPDGHTLFAGSTAPVLVSPLTLPKAPYAWDKAFAPVGLVTVFPAVLLVKKELPVSNLRGFIELAKKEPGKLTLSTGGAGSINHLGSELLQKLSGAKWLQVHYRGNAPGLVDLAGGHVDSALTQPSDALPHIQKGSVRALAILGPERLPAFPGVPTVAEEGYQEAVAVGFVGLLAPAGTPAPIIEKLSTALSSVVSEVAIKKRLDELGVQAKSLPANEFRRFLATEEARWKPIIRDNNIKSN